MTLDPAINPVFFNKHAQHFGRFEPVLEWRLGGVIKQYLLANQIRVVMLGGYNDLARLRLIQWANRAGLPLLLTADSNIHAEGRLSVPKRLVKILFMRWLIRRLAGLMPGGSAGLAYFRSYLDHDKPTFLFPYEPDYAAIRACDDATRGGFMNKHGLAPARKRLLFVGRLVAVKRPADAIEAFIRIAPDRPDWDLVLAGDGPLRQSLQAAVPPMLSDRVRWTGFLQMEDVIPCYHACDVLVLPSDYEPWALVVSEAVAAGLAVVTSDVVGAAVDLVRPGVNGRTFPPRQIDQLANALLEVTDPAHCARYKENSGRILNDWVSCVDPVASVRRVVRHFVP